MAQHSPEDLEDSWARRPLHFQIIEWDTSIEHNFRPPKFPASTFEEQKARGFWGDTLRYADHCVVDEDGKPGEFVPYADLGVTIQSLAVPCRKASWGARAGINLEDPPCIERAA